MAQTSPLSNLPMDDVKLPQEIEEGNVEYKLMLNPSAERLQHLITQMKWR
jgi:GTPase